MTENADAVKTVQILPVLIKSLQKSHSLLLHHYRQIQFLFVHTDPINSISLKLLIILNLKIMFSIIILHFCFYISSSHLPVFSLTFTHNLLVFSSLMLVQDAASFKVLSPLTPEPSVTDTSTLSPSCSEV